jgi:hypothetical protein
MVRREICGNICCTFSTSASRALRLLALEFDCVIRADVPLKKSHRITIPPIKRASRSVGMLIVCSSAILGRPDGYDLHPVQNFSEQSFAAINVVSIRD